MKIIKYILSVLLAASLVGCNKFGDMNVDNNTLSQPNSAYFLLRAEMYTPFFVINDTYNPWTQILPGYYSEPRNFQFTKLTPSFYQFSTGNIYRIAIGNCEEIIRLNAANDEQHIITLGGGKNNQIAVAQTLRAFYYMHLTDALGMVPYADANKALEDNFFPAYNTTKDIYNDLEKRLNEAYAMFNTSDGLNGTYDVVYGGDMGKWKKLNASIRMMMAIKLADIDPTAGKARFEKAFKDGGIVNNSDALIFKYLNENDNCNPLYKNIIVQGRRDFSPSNYVVDNMLELKDPRLPIYATTVEGKFTGSPFGVKNAKSNPYSEFQPKYYGMDTPIEVISAAHILLIQAEAALRGWIPGKAADFYKKGIESSFMATGVEPEMAFADVEPALGAELTANSNIDKYLAQPTVALTGDMNGDLKKIAMQRWINNYMKDGVEAWSDIRRLDWPMIKPGAEAELPTMPLRMTYHPDDYDANMKQYEATIAVQPDKLTTKIWWDVK